MRDVIRLSKWAFALVGTGGALLLGGTSRAEAPAKAAPAKAAAKVLPLAVTDKGFEPAQLSVKKGEPVTLRVTRKTDQTCATELLIQDTAINVPLPLGKPVDVAFTPAKTGKVKFGCGMDKMIGGVLLVE